MTVPAISSDPWTKATHDEKVAALAGMNSMPSRQNVSSAVNLAGYLIALDGVTRYGLTTAVKAILQGALGHAFYPSPPELRLQCNEAMKHYVEQAERKRQQVRENADFNRQFAGAFEPKPEASRQRVKEIHKAFTDKWRQEQLGEEEMTPALFCEKYKVKLADVAKMTDTTATRPE